MLARKIKYRSGMAYSRKGAQTMVQALVMGDTVLNSFWPILIWVAIGALAGYAADQIIPGGKLGIVWSIVAGCLGGLIGGTIMGIIPEAVSAYINTFLTALIGAFVLVPVARMLLAGRRKPTTE
jgi:uncharacterized membrane protein YeaQ/YmgE (transglycosylase-associated protein family)